MLLNSYLWKKGIKKNRFSNDLDDMKSIIPRTSLNEISFMQNILLEETKVEIKNINLSRGGTVVLMPDSNIEGGEEEPVVEEKEEEPVVEEKEEEPVVEGGNESEGGFMELEEGPSEDIGIDEPILPPNNEGGDSDIKHVVVTKFF